jgi:hypothetical protein
VTGIEKALRIQQEGCAQLGSPLYAGLLERLRANVESGGVGARVLEPFADWPGDSAYVLRLMGAVNRLVLTGEAPDLAPHFAPGGDPEAAWPAFQALLADQGDEIQSLALARPVQTNEVGRSAALAPAILWLSGGMPVRLLELGASAGLNLRWDAFRYEESWGDRDSPVRLTDRYDGAPPPFEPPSIDVVERRGCDARPVDPGTEEGRLTLLSYVWPDQSERLSLLRGALDIARTIPAQVDAVPAGEWLADVLGSQPSPPGTLTVIYHSVFWQYLGADERERLGDVLAEAGARATPDRPLAWLRMEPGGRLTRLDATLWPGGGSHLIARAGYHGRPVRWLADGQGPGFALAPPSPPPSW